MPYAIHVELDVDPARMEAFLVLVKANAKAARENEPGCLQFTVSIPHDAPNKVVLFEQYKSEADLATHRQQPHYVEMQKAAAGMILNRRVTTLQVVF